MTDRFDHWAAARQLDGPRLRAAFSLVETVDAGRPCVAMNTPFAGVKRLRYLDSRGKKAGWKKTAPEKRAGAFWFGLEQAQQLLGDGPLYLVNGEPSVFALYLEGVPAVCTAAGEQIPNSLSLEPVKKLGRPVKVIFDRDAAGEKGALAAVRRLRSEGIDAKALQLPASVGPSGDAEDLFKLPSRTVPLAQALANLPELSVTQAAPQTELWRVEVEKFAALSSGRFAGMQRIAYTLGGFVGRGDVTEAEAIDALFQAAQRNGWTKKRKNARAEIQAQVRNGARQPFLTSGPSVSPTSGSSVPPRTSPAGKRVGQFVVGADGIWERVGRGQVKKIARAPVEITHVERDQATDELLWGLRWRWPGQQWESCTALRERAASARTIVETAKVGAPMHSENARSMVRYLAAYEDQHRQALPVHQVTSQLGWTAGQQGFLWGRELITQDGEQAEKVKLRGDCMAYTDAAPGFFSLGSAEEWKAIVQRGLEKNTVAAVGVLGALAAPLLGILGLPTFVIDWCGETSRGKTTVLRAAASVWGDPRGPGLEPTCVISTYESTPVYLETLVAALGSIPLCIDDTKTVGRWFDVSRWVYNVCAGRSRGRGKPGGGVRPTYRWRTIVLTTGENPIVDQTDSGGTRARVLTLWGDPFAGPDSGQTVAELTAGVFENFGWAGPAFVRQLLDHREDWPLIAQLHTAYRNRLTDTAGEKSSVKNRLAGYFALLELVAELARQYRIIEFSVDLASLWDRVAEEGSRGADRAAQALERVWAWCASNAHALFPGIGASPMPSTGWAGRWDREGGAWREVALRPDRIERLLDGFDVSATLRSWRDRGWLRLQKSDRQRNTCRVRLDGQLVRLIVIRRSAIEHITGGSDRE